MPSDLRSSTAVNPPEALRSEETSPWHSFENILRRLHAEGIYIHADQLAEFLLRHGLPVHPRYVPPQLQQKAKLINQHYQGDMARLEEDQQPPYSEPF